MLRKDTEVVEPSQLSSFIRHCEEETGRRFARSSACSGQLQHGEDFHAFSVREFRRFWRLVLDFLGSSTRARRSLCATATIARQRASFRSCA